MNNQNRNEEYYKKKYFKYKAKYLKLQKGGIYIKSKNLINPNSTLEVGKIKYCDVFYDRIINLRKWNKIMVKAYTNLGLRSMPNKINLLAFDNNSNILISSHQGTNLSILKQDGTIEIAEIYYEQGAQGKKFIDAAFYDTYLIIIYGNEIYIFIKVRNLYRYDNKIDGINEKKFNNLKAIAIRVKEKPEICVTDKDGIHIFDCKDKKFLQTIKCENNNFNSIAIDSKNNIVVCDEFNNSIQIFKPDNLMQKTIKKILPEGTNLIPEGTNLITNLITTFRDELINRPYRIIFDKDENLLIGSKEKNYITILNYKHESQKKINLSVKYCIRTELEKPISFLIDSSGIIFFTSEEDNSIFKEDVCANIFELGEGEISWHSENIPESKKK